MKRRTMKTLIQILTITTVLSGSITIVLLTQHSKYEKAIEENILLNDALENIHNNNNKATYRHYEELKKDLTYKIVLNDGTYAILDREADKYELYIKDIKPYITSLESEEDLIQAIKTYITAHEYKRGLQ